MAVDTRYAPPAPPMTWKAITELVRRLTADQDAPPWNDDSGRPDVVLAPPGLELPPAVLTLLSWLPQQDGKIPRQALVATHPNTPPAVLTRMARGVRARGRSRREIELWLMARLLENPSLPAQALEHLFAHYQNLRHGAEARTLQLLHEDPLADLVAHPNLPAALLQEIEGDLRRRARAWIGREHAPLIRGLLRNPNLSAEALSHWTHQIVRGLEDQSEDSYLAEHLALIASHPNVSQTTTARIGQCLDTTVSDRVWRIFLRSIPEALLPTAAAHHSAVWLRRGLASDWGKDLVRHPLESGARTQERAEGAWEILAGDALRLPPGASRDAALADLVLAAPGPVLEQWERLGSPAGLLPTAVARTLLLSPQRPVREAALRMLGTTAPVPTPGAPLDAPLPPEAAMAPRRADPPLVQAASRPPRRFRP